jgi:hypothetical protein
VAGTRVSYTPRRLLALGVRERGGWRLKVTQVLAAGRAGDPDLVDAALAAAAGFLPSMDESPLQYGVGIVIVHQGSRYDFVLVGYWTYETELRYQTFMRASTDSTRLEPLTAGELATDVWDLRVLAYERDAWLEHVLRAVGSGDEADWAGRLERYLRAQVQGTL